MTDKPEKIQIDLSSSTKSALASAQRRKQSRTVFDLIESIAGSAVIVVFSALLITGMLWLIGYISEHMTDLPYL